MNDSITSLHKYDPSRHSSTRSVNRVSFSEQLSKTFKHPRISVSSTTDVKSLEVNIQQETSAGSEGSSIGVEWNSEKPRKWSPWVDGNYVVPYVEMPNEVNFLGGLGPNAGHPRSNVYIQRPTTIQKVYNMRTGNRTVFTFCEDPKKANNVVQKAEKIDYRNLKRIRKCVERVRLSQNIETPPPSDFSEDPTEIFDDENPLKLDFQGLDHQQTYQRDEQELQNRREYFIQKRHIEKKVMIKKTFNEYRSQQLQKKFSELAIYDVNVIVEGDEDLQTESVPAPEEPWTEKYRLKSLPFEPLFQRPIPDAIPYVPPPAIFAELTRTVDKVENKVNAEDDRLKRQEKLNELQKRKCVKDEAALKLKLEQEKQERKNEVFNIGQKDYESHFKDEYHDLEMQYATLPPIYAEKKYPHTLRETKYLQRLMNRSRRVIHDEATLRNEFNLEMGLNKPIIDVVEADEQSIDASELSEQSTDDEDGLSVGQKTAVQYELRGFQYTLGDELRGKFDVKPKTKLQRPPRSCITRKEWFDELAQTRRGHALFNAKNDSLPNRALPNDPDYILHRTSVIPPKPITIAPVKEMIEGTGEEPKILNAKQPKLKTPKYTKIRKFNMTAYIFGQQKKEKTKKSIAMDGGTENKYGVSYDMILKCDKLFKKKKNQNKAMRHNRMRALGIPIIHVKKPDDDELASSSESENSDWVPDKDDDTYQQVSADCSIAGQINHANIDIPEYREPTHQLIRKMRNTKCRKYLRRKNASQNSLSFFRRNSMDEELIPEMGPVTYEVPRLSELASDVILQPNLHVKRTQFTDLFQTRHHHPHHDGTQHKTAYVKYLPKIPKFQLPPGKKERAAKMKPFQRAIYRDGRPLQEDLALPKLIIENPSFVEEKENQTVSNTNALPAMTIPSTAPHRSRAAIEQNPDKAAFRHLLLESNQQAALQTKSDKKPPQMAIDVDKFVERLKDEVDSIKSCNSSNTSTVCTNYTNDSGSFLELEGVKVPCSYITKSQVPFEEIDRSRVIAGPIEKNDEYYGPYYAVPFSGQKMDMRQLSLPKDKFFTSGVRSRYGIRNRLNVHVPGFGADQIGVKDKKRISQLATEWDSYYQNEILTRHRICRFKPRTILEQARCALRKNFISNYIQESIIEKAVVMEKEKQYAEEVLNFDKICNPLFTQWEDKHYRKYMRKMQDVKPYYDLTAKLKNELTVATNKYVRIEMSIIYLEDDWRRRTIMQNFHYLLSDLAWRQTHDWIHRKPDGTLENFQESIIKRPYVNLRVRGKDNAFVIKKFHEDYFQNENARNVHIVFQDYKEFMNGLQKLKIKSFVCLLELHFAMWVLSNLQHGYNTFKEWSQNYINRREKFVKTRCAKKYFNENLSATLKHNAHELVEGPLQDAVSASKLRTLMALCETLFVQIVPIEVRDNLKSDADEVDKFTIIVNIVMNLLEKLDQIPHRIRVVAERKVRNRRSFISRQAKRACDLENRIKLTTIQMKKNLAPPYIRVPPTHPLERSYLPKKVIIKEEPKVEISELDKLYYKAFTDVTQITDVKRDDKQTDEKVAIIRTLEASCIPFYFDVFLRQNQYFPAYDFKTEIEMSEGSEFKQFKYEDVLDNVQHNLRIWEQNKQRIMDQNIEKTWHLYASRVSV